MLRADLHVHTCYSLDCNMTPQTIIRRCAEVGIDCIAVTDHNSIAGALALQQSAPFKVIAGEEVLTSDGEVMGLFLVDEIPRGLSPEDTASRIKAQGGLVCIPHPFDRFRTRSSIRRRFLEPLLPYIDIIEVFNSRSLMRRGNDQAQLFAERHGLLSGAGSDAHTPGEIGNAYVEMPEFNDAEHFLSALAQGNIVGRRANPFVHFGSITARLRNRF